MKAILTLLAALTAYAASAQEVPLVVKGQVTDAATGEGVPFASVHLEGTMTGTSTDGDGFYELLVPSDGILVFSSISSISQASLYFDSTNINTNIFIKKV